MKIVIDGKNIELTESLKDYVHDKLMKLQHHYENIIKGHDVKVKLSVLKNPRITKNNITEVTIFLDRNIIRSEQASEDMYASIDIVADKLDRQIQKYKAKSYRSYQHKERPRPKSGSGLESAPELSNTLLSQSSENNKKFIKEGKIIKSKRFLIHPMTPEEATHQLDLISHDFYVFVNSTTNQTNIIYKRKDSDYGLIEPVVSS